MSTGIIATPTTAKATVKVAGSGLIELVKVVLTVVKSAGLFLAFSICVHAQDLRLAGCYQVTSLTWNQSDKTSKYIPEQFELTTTPIASTDAFEMRRIGKEPEMWTRLWSWKPRGKNDAWVSFSHGLGGFKGTLKESDGILSGKIKEWCDYRCGWKKWIGELRLQRIACAS